MILCVAGQSNAVGYDESPVAANALTRFDRTRIAQLGLYGEDNLRVVPLGVCAQNLQDMRPYGHPSNPGVGTKGIHLPLPSAAEGDPGGLRHPRDSLRVRRHGLYRRGIRCV